ncbi:hypothetical protein [Sphingomonas sp. URHD0057]|uniref:hypothetical protein n=1 Tax=Sphingomonas sp. URHD0057 TaxID=1380389 RepID=UPI0004920EBF|nr:hypothetical protein [Sphingomonas sp. URHD0057]
MRVFGTKPIEPTDEDRAAAARLSAVAARFKAEPVADFTDVEPDPFEAPEALDEPDGESDAADEPDGDE